MGLASIFRWNRISPFSRWGDLHTWGNCFCLSSLDQPYPIPPICGWMSCNPKKKWLQPGKEKNRLQRIRYPPSIIGVSCFFSVVYLLPAPWRCVSLLSLLRNRALNVCEVLQVWMMSTWKTLLTIFGSWPAICWNSDTACKGFFLRKGYLVKEEDTVIWLLLNHEFKIGGMGSGQTLKSWHFTCQHWSRRQIPKTPGAKRYRLDHWMKNTTSCVFGDVMLVHEWVFTWDFLPKFTRLPLL